ncbi:hypothetical protein Tco_0958181 [Tanacetum coccineum]
MDLEYVARPLLLFYSTLKIDFGFRSAYWVSWSCNQSRLISIKYFTFNYLQYGVVGLLLDKAYVNHVPLWSLVSAAPDTVSLPSWKLTHASPSSSLRAKEAIESWKKKTRDPNASSSSTTLNHSSLFHPLDDIVDVNDEESFRSNSSSPSQNVSSSSNVVSRVLQNPPHESQHLNTYLSETINLQTQHRDDLRKGLRSIGKNLKDMMSGNQKLTCLQN